MGNPDEKALSTMGASIYSGDVKNSWCANAQIEGAYRGSSAGYDYSSRLTWRAFAFDFVLSSADPFFRRDASADSDTDVYRRNTAHAQVESLFSAEAKHPGLGCF